MDKKFGFEGNLLEIGSRKQSRRRGAKQSRPTLLNSLHFSDLFHGFLLFGTTLDKPGLI